jgi:hypothetical protein
MPLTPTSLKDYLYLYGNYSIKNNQFLIGRTDNESSNPIEIGEQVLARGTGSRITTTRNRSKSIKVKGELAILDLSIFSIESVYRKLNKLYSYQNRMLRVMPSWLAIADSTMSAQWLASDDAQNLAQDTTEYQFNGQSLKFDINVAASANNFATLAGAFSTPVNISSLIDKGSIDFWLEIPDVYFVTSIDFRIGSDASNYWSYNFTSNYEGKPFENGVNYFSCPFSKSSTVPCFVNKMAEVGSPVFSAADYAQIRINYSSSAVNIPNCRFGEIFAVDETRVANYFCYRRGEIKIDRKYDYSVRVRSYDVDLNNYLGYGQATHPRLVANQTGITSLSNTQLIDFEGSFDPYPTVTLTLNSVTNLNNLTIKNLNNNELVQFTNTWVAADSVVLDKIAEIDAQGRQPVRRNGVAQDFSGKIPSFALSKNRIQLLVTTGSNTLITQASTNANYSSTTQSGQYVAQSFTTTITGTLSVAKLLSSGEGGISNAYIYSNSAGNPGTLLWSGTISSSASVGSPTYSEINPNVAIVNGTVYWVVVQTKGYNFNPPGGTFYRVHHSTTNPYAGGQVKTSPDLTTWTSVAANDLTFELTQTPTPSTNIDLNISYTPLYS